MTAADQDSLHELRLTYGDDWRIWVVPAVTDDEKPYWYAQRFGPGEEPHYERSAKALREWLAGQP
jgi:hypothetical protein